ncbi:hypothetical protein EAF00_008526 [Botryotinia globosa]|nr:hypothetical protein EAF00_008526 [Botryotinia globosa]
MIDPSNTMKEFSINSPEALSSRAIGQYISSELFLDWRQRVYFGVLGVKAVFVEWGTLVFLAGAMVFA